METSISELEVTLAKNNINILSVEPCDWCDGEPVAFAVAYEYQWRLPTGVTKWQKMVKLVMTDIGAVFDIANVYKAILGDVASARKELERSNAGREWRH